MVAYDFSGHEVWRRPLPLLIQHGTASSSRYSSKGRLSYSVTAPARTQSCLRSTPGPARLRGEPHAPPPRAVGRLRSSGPRMVGRILVTLGSNRVVTYGSDGTERWWVTGPYNPADQRRGHRRWVAVRKHDWHRRTADPIDIPQMGCHDRRLRPRQGRAVGTRRAAQRRRFPPPS